MRTRGWIGGVALFLVLIGFGSAAQAEVVQTIERSYLMKYPDGTTDTYIAEYKAVMNVSHWESGHPAIPLKGWFVDNRQCHWHITTQISRRIGLVARSGQTYWSDALSRIYGTDFSGKGSDLIVWRLASENCGQAEARFESDVNDVKETLIRNVPTVVDNDTSQVIKDLKTQVHSGVSVVPK